MANKMTTMEDTPLTLEGETCGKQETFELDADKFNLVAETFSHVELYMQSNSDQGYVKLNGPGFYSFELPADIAPNGGRHEVYTENVLNKEELMENLTKESLIEINMITPEMEKKLGQLERDEVTGELYMLVPIELDVLLDPDYIEFNSALQQLEVSQAGSSSASESPRADKQSECDVAHEQLPDANQTSNSNEPKEQMEQPKDELNSDEAEEQPDLKLAKEQLELAPASEQPPNRANEQPKIKDCEHDEQHESNLDTEQLQVQPDNEVPVVIDSSLTVDHLQEGENNLESASKLTLIDRPKPCSETETKQELPVEEQPMAKRVLSEHEVCRFLVPKMSLMFQLTFQTDD